MTSKIVVNNIGSDTGINTVTFDSNVQRGSSNFHSVGVEVAGVNVLGADTPIGTGSTIYDDGGARFSGIVTATTFVGNLTGNPTGSGANLTNIPAGNLTGTVADARISTLTASKLTGALPAISGASLTGISAGLNASYARITDTKGSATQGGSFTSGAWRTRDLNTEDEDPDGIVSISSNQFTLQAGTYYIKAQACGINVNNHTAKIYNITDSSDTLIGNSNKTQPQGNNVSAYALIQGSFTIAAAKTFELQHRCSTTQTTHGFGAYNGFSANVYATVEIYKRN